MVDRQLPKFWSDKYFLTKLLNVEPKLSYLGIFWLELEKATALCFFKSAPSNFFKQNFVQKKKSLNLGPKLDILDWNFKKCQIWNQYLRSRICYLGIFGLQFNKIYYQICNQHTRICETIKVSSKTRKINLGPKILYLVLWMECWKTIVIFLVNALQIV